MSPVRGTMDKGEFGKSDSPSLKGPVSMLLRLYLIEKSSMTSSREHS